MHLKVIVEKSSQITHAFIICNVICLFVVVHFAHKKTFIPPGTRLRYGFSTAPNCTRCSSVGIGKRMIRPTLHGIGNHLFYYSAIMYVAWLTGRRPCILSKSRDVLIKRVFDVDIPLVDIKTSGCPIYKFQHHCCGVYDKRMKELVHISKNTTLELRGFFQTWKYAEPIAMQLRQQLKFKNKITEFVTNFLSTCVPPGWSKLEFVRVGIHVRRGDFFHKGPKQIGFNTADEWYLTQAMNYFVDRFPRIQFIVASDDISWCQKHVNVSVFNNTNVNITFSVKHNAAQDLALLATCNHTVMTTGSYSWWAAWLANGIAVYYANFPKRRSHLSRLYHSEEYYHPNWVGIDDVK